MPLSDWELTRDEMDAAWALNRAEGVAHAAAQKMATWIRSLPQLSPFEAECIKRELERQALANGERLPMPNLHEPVDDPGPQIDRAEELREKWGTERGQVWEIGDAQGLSYRKPHRLVCGDTTDVGTLDLLCSGNDPDLIIADPPYGVSYAEKNESLNAISPANRIQTPMEGDHQDSDQAAEVLWGPAFKNLYEVARRGTVFYCFAPQGGDQMMMMMMRANFNPKMHQLVWLKNNHVLGRVDYAYIHEPIIYTWKDSGHKFYGPFQTSVIECARRQVNDLHPTMKPVELIGKLIENSSKAAEIVLDPFLGSGTTMVAAEQLGRICYGMDIEPKYVAVTLERMAGMGLEPRLVESNSSVKRG